MYYEFWCTKVSWPNSRIKRDILYLKILLKRGTPNWPITEVWASNLKQKYIEVHILNTEDANKGCIRIKLYNGLNKDFFTGNERVLFDRTRCNSQENFICSVEPMFSADLERFNNQSTDPLEQMIRKPSDFVADCDQNQLDNIDTNIDGKFFQFGGPFNGRKTCYYLR